MLFTVAGLAIGRIDTLVRKPERFVTTVKLSERELSILRLISHGESTAETAAYLKIAPETVKHHVKRAMRKLKARDRAQAVAFTCTRRGGHARSGSPAFSPTLSLLDTVISEAGMTEGLIMGPMSPIESDLQIVCNLPQLEGGTFSGGNVAITSAS
jgi:DNA-binding CsgD family transcriptional regulator